MLHASREASDGVKPALRRHSVRHGTYRSPVRRGRLSFSCTPPWRRLKPFSYGRKKWPAAVAKLYVTPKTEHSLNGHPGPLRALPFEPGPGTSKAIDPVAAQQAATDLLTALGANLTDESLSGTPRRIARLYAELLTPAPFTATTFPNDGGYDELIVARAIPFHSLCEHHLLPFVGVAHVGYLPGQRILGLSKLARVIDYFARSLQVQERLTAQVAGWLECELLPKGVGVVLEAEHMCISLRGIQKHGATTVTSALHGLVRDDPSTRQEFLALTGRTTRHA